MADLLSLPDLPDGFDYPAEFVRAVEAGLANLEPWWVLEGDFLRAWHVGLRTRFPGRSLVPFAVRQDRDDLACFDVEAGGVVVIDNFADDGWEARTSFSGFNDWLRQAVEDFIEFEIEPSVDP